MTQDPTDVPPPIWVGHVSLESLAIADSTALMERLGMRAIVRGEKISVLELRGGTHLVVKRVDELSQKESPFDLMVADLEKAHGDFESWGFEPSEIARGRIHDSFRVWDPGGVQLRFNSSHVVGVV
ncbi:MAG: hypothetical protein AAGF12_11285 [Myxococcota bacterium]